MAKRKRKTITRQEILTAITAEPLVNGHWVQRSIHGKVSKDENCPVCAVGGVLRKVGFTNREIYHFGQKMMYNGPYAEGDIDYMEEALEDKQYIHALSIKFESLACQYSDLKKVRCKLSDFVKQNFPGRIKLDYRY